MRKALIFKKTKGPKDVEGNFVCSKISVGGKFECRGISVKGNFNCSGMSVGGNFDLTGMRIYTGSLNMGNTKNVKA